MRFVVTIDVDDQHPALVNTEFVDAFGYDIPRLIQTAILYGAEGMWVRDVRPCLDEARTEARDLSDA